MATFKKTFGDWGEWLVGEEYLKRGYKVIAKNVKVVGYKQLGEIDLIAKNSREVVFVEVKARQNQAFMPLVETVGYQKAKKMLKAVKAYLTRHPEFAGLNIRLDVALVEAPLDGKFHRVNIIEDAIQDTA